MRQGNPCTPVVIPQGSSGNVCPSYLFPATPEALRCPWARTATWALRMSHTLLPRFPQPSLWQGPATNSRNESEAGMAEGPAAHLQAFWHVCPSCSTTGDWSLPITESHGLVTPGDREISGSSHWKREVLSSPFLKGQNSSCGLFQHQGNVPRSCSGQNYGSKGLCPD